MLKTSIEMVLKPQSHNNLKMSMVNMSINSKKSLKNCLNHRHKVFWKRNTLF